MKTFQFQIILIYLFVILNSINCDKSSDPKCCANATDRRVVVEFASTVVQHEYIVQFKDYYHTEARKKFLKAALDNSEVWLILINN